MYVLNKHTVSLCLMSRLGRFLGNTTLTQKMCVSPIK